MSERMSVRRREVVMMLCFGDGWGGERVGGGVGLINCVFLTGVRYTRACRARRSRRLYLMQWNE